MLGFVCAHCGMLVPYLQEDMCQVCYDRAMEGLHPSWENWFERINKQITEILKEIQDINSKLRG